MNNRKALDDKITKRIGMTATTKDKIRTGTITSYTIETLDAGTTHERLTVNYLLAYGNHPHAELRLVNENLVILLKEPNN